MYVKIDLTEVLAHVLRDVNARMPVSGVTAMMSRMISGILMMAIIQQVLRFLYLKRLY